jgi:hypothetical protein
MPGNNGKEREDQAPARAGDNLPVRGADALVRLGVDNVRRGGGSVVRLQSGCHDNALEGNCDDQALCH